MLIQAPPPPSRHFDQGVAETIAYFDRDNVRDRAWDPDRKEYCIGLLDRPERDQLMEEILRCQDDFEYTARNYFEIIDNRGVERPFVLWPSQMLLLEKWYELKAKKRQQKILIVKARRLGCSTVVESLMAWRTMFFPNQAGIIISNESKHASYLFRILLHIHDKLPWWMKPMVASRKEEEGLIFNNPDQNDRRVNPGLQSEILVQAATMLDAGGQGRRVSCLHASEFATWDDDAAATIINEDMKPALGEDPEAFAFLESTAKGAGRFAHKFWRDNVRLKENAEWYPLFLPWFFEKSRVLPPENGWVAAKPEQDMRDRAMRDWLKCSNESCEEYRESAIYTELFEEPCPKCGVGKMMPLYLLDEQLMWMFMNRINAEGDEKRRKSLAQEYAATAESAFQISGYQLFNDQILEYVNSTIRAPIMEGDFDSKGNFHGVSNKKTGQCYQGWCTINHRHDTNALRIWKVPEAGKTYTAGVDVAEGLGGQADYSVIWINAVAPFPGAPDEHCATYRNNEIDPLPFAAVCNWTGRWYNEALMCVECNKYDTTLSQLRQNWLYPNIFRWKWVDSTNMLSNKWGWWTNMSSKPRLWQTAKKWLKDKCWIIYSDNCMEEMKTFQKESAEDRGASAENNMKDDEIIAAMICLYCSHDMDYGDQQTATGPHVVTSGTGENAVEQGGYTATCTRCPRPAWQLAVNPEWASCPSCGCRVIKASPNRRVKPSVEVDFTEMGRMPGDDNGGAPLSSFELMGSAV